MKRNESILKLTRISLLAALIVVLQLLGGFIKIGPFNLSFVLVPIVVGSLLMGPSSGAVLGGIFGVVVVIQCATGIDPSGALLWGINPFFTILICMAKGIMAGVMPGLIMKLFKKKNTLAAIISSVLAPVTNTALFCIGLSLFFNDVLIDWAGGTNVFVFIITGLVGINFIIEFIINAILAPIILRIVNATKNVEI